MEDELLQDELPSPPHAGAAAVSEPIDDTFDAALLTDVPKMGEAIPAGTYVFRLDSFTEEWSKSEWFKDGTSRELAPEEREPYYRLLWRCQQEPHTGRVVGENVPWVKASDVKDANNPNSPRKAEARKVINNRMPRAKEIMEAAGFTPTGQFGFKDFLKSNPEMRLQLKLKARRAKAPSGKYEPTGDWDNEVQKHISLHRPM